METTRPGIITAICIISVLGGLASIPLIFSIGGWHTLYLSLASVLGLICMVGLWMMRKWSVVAYTIFFVINQVILLTIGTWNIFALLPLIVIAIGFSQYNKMH
jgi:hypothetical protein